MKIRPILAGGLFLMSTILPAGFSSAGEGEYASLDGLREVRAVFDMRAREIKTAALQLDLIHQTYHDRYIRDVRENPEMAVVISGAAVRIASSDREEYTDEEIMLLDLIAGKVAAMIKDGIRIEICLFAADVFDVEEETILPGIHHVENGWISLIGYQSKGFALVPVF